MVSLSNFIGQIISDIANARSMADYSAASISERYYADPFVKSLPIPHYIIDEAEVDVPVMIVGISKQSDAFDKQKLQLIESINEKLPLLLIRGYKYNFIREREKLQMQEENKQKSEEKIMEEANSLASSKQKKQFDMSKYAFTDAQLERFSESAKAITEKICASIKQYVDNYNYEILKILELSDEFIKQLTREIKWDIRSFPDSQKPYLSEERIGRSVEYMSNLMFFEFKKIMRSDAGVNVDIKTVQMNEYATKDCLMHIKFKIKEQDLNLIVEEGKNGKERRYLSLT